MAHGQLFSFSVNVRYGNFLRGINLIFPVFERCMTSYNSFVFIDHYFAKQQAQVSDQSNTHVLGFNLSSFTGHTIRLREAFQK